MSFWKQEPPKPTEALRNLGPMRESNPTAWATCCTSAPVSSQSADIAFIDDTRCASIAFAVSLDSSADHRLARSTRRGSTQRSYTEARVSTAALPSGVSLPPMSTRSGFSRSAMAVPSAKNSGLDRISNLTLDSVQLRVSTFSMASAVFTGTVDFSTTILSVVDTRAIMRAAPSQYVRSAALPAPTPRVLVGVLTETNTMSASATCLSVSVEKNRLRPRHALTTSSRPGS